MDLFELLEIAEKERKAKKPIRITCCTAAGCLSLDGQSLKLALQKAVTDAKIEDKVTVVGVGCMGLCSEGPLVKIEPNNILYGKVKPEDATSIIASINGGKCNVKTIDMNHPFFSRQTQIALENSGKIDPERIEDYIASEGYLALYRILHEMKPVDVVNSVTKSGLRGRGGAGFPTGLKWSLVAKANSDKKYVICNADEGDPGAFMDRSILESDPHKILEGMAIAAYAVGAQQGFIYVRGEYPLAINRLTTAIRQSRKLGLTGAQIFESSFDFRIDIRIGAGAFVCGEETALMASVEGKRGNPRSRPPFPAESGLWGYPTLINNVETYANITSIIKNGDDWFRKIGTEKSKGTKVFALAGNIVNTGLIEVPMGISIGEIINDMGGGVPDGGKVKAVQTGGPSGGCIPLKLFDTKVDYESLMQVGSIMGSGGMIVMDETANMVKIAKFFIEFCMEESCGKCVPCRAGTKQASKILDKISDGNGTQADMKNLEDLCKVIKESSLCGLGQSAPNPVLSTIYHFNNEYQNLLKDKKTEPKKETKNK
jgi:bidirectional [NiFe] hydrogenase diaphorase subunit